MPETAAGDGVTLFAGQFLLLFVALAMGLPPGLPPSPSKHRRRLVVLAAIFLRDAPAPSSVVGMLGAFLDSPDRAQRRRNRPIAALAVGVAAAFSWAIGNILIKRLGPVPILPLVAWLSLIPPLPALVVWFLLFGSRIVRGDCRRRVALSVGAVLYLGLGATLIAYAIWGRLLSLYPTSMVAPFTLLVPVIGVAASGPLS